jgi:cytochrome P450 family 4
MIQQQGMCTYDSVCFFYRLNFFFISGISFTLYNLAKYPEIQQKVFEEVKSNLGDGNASMQDLNGLNYLELVIKETLRLYSSVPFYGRHLTEDATFNDYTIPAGTMLTMSPFLLGRDAKLFPDPLKFDPMQFAVETNNEKNNPYAFIPFSAGPRNCIGQKFAMLEMKSIVSKIIKNFELSIKKENEKLHLCSHLVLRSENGIVLNVQKRK